MAGRERKGRSWKAVCVSLNYHAAVGKRWQWVAWGDGVQ